LLLSTDVNNCLRREKLIYINDLEVYAENFEQLIKIRKVGNKAANEITSRLNAFCINEKRKMDLQVLKENSDYHLLWENKAELIEIIIKKDS
jgi:DNA-directed RNA polymerase alpha subunit